MQPTISISMATSRPTALPSVRARVLAFCSIVLAGISGALIGWGIVDVECRGNCAVPEGIGMLTGGVITAAGVAVVAVLVLRAMGEWRRIQLDAREREPD